jgi:hypothetical protein
MVVQERAEDGAGRETENENPEDSGGIPTNGPVRPKREAARDEP